MIDQSSRYQWEGFADIKGRVSGAEVVDRGANAQSTQLRWVLARRVRNFSLRQFQ